MLAFVTPVVEQWLEQNIDQWIHQVGSIHQTTVSGCFIYNRATFCPVTKKKKEKKKKKKEREREMFYLTTHSTHFIYGSTVIWRQAYG